MILTDTHSPPLSLSVTEGRSYWSFKSWHLPSWLDLTRTRSWTKPQALRVSLWLLSLYLFDGSQPSLHFKIGIIIIINYYYVYKPNEGIAFSSSAPFKLSLNKNNRGTCMQTYDLWMCAKNVKLMIVWMHQDYLREMKAATTTHHVGPIILRSKYGLLWWEAA